jgi:hypothetical protein
VFKRELEDGAEPDLSVVTRASAQHHEQGEQGSAGAQAVSL